MREEDYLELMRKTEEVQSIYSKNSDRKLIITRLDYINKYPYTTTRLQGLFNPLQFGFTDRHFGGQVDKVAKIDGKEMYILADSGNKTLGVYIPWEALEDLKIADLKEIADMQSKKYKGNISKEEIIEVIKKV